MKGNQPGRELGNSREVHTGIRESKRELLQYSTLGWVLALAGIGFHSIPGTAVIIVMADVVPGRYNDTISLLFFSRMLAQS